MDIVMPKMGESVNEGTVIKWHKKKGDKIKRDEIIFEISTDKVDTEIPSPADGVLKEIKVQEGDTVEVGSVVAVIDANGETAKEEEPEDKTKDEELKKEEKDSGEHREEKGVKEKEKIVESKNVEDEMEEETEEKKESSSNGDELIEVTMPKMGESVMEGTIIKWFKKTNDSIKKDETLFEISTDKVDTEVPSPAEGIIAEILVGEQETVEVGTIVAKISTGKMQSKKETIKEDKPKKEEAKKEDRKEKEPAAMHDGFAKHAAGNGEKNESSKFYSPLVMNISQKENVSFEELEEIEGTGLEGRISKKDILNYLEDRKAGKAKPAKKEERKEEKKELITSSSKMEPVYSSDEVEKIEMDNIRQKIMQHMIKSRDTSVHVSAMLEVDMTKIHNFIHKNRDEYLKKEGVKLTYMPFISNAVVKGLKKYPLVNATVEGTTIIKKKYINLGIAVAIEPTGLIVPNIKAAGERNIIGLAKAINDLAQRARTRKLTPDDISNGTFTITNYGLFGTIFGTPIINQPEVAILGVGTVAKKPVVVEVDGMDTIAIKPTMALTLSHDHRLVDGMLGGRFLKFIKDTLENFDLNLL